MTQTFSYQHLFRFVVDVLIKMGCPQEHANLAASVLLAADVRGIDSHGVSRLVGYVRLWKREELEQNQTFILFTKRLPLQPLMVMRAWVW